MKTITCSDCGTERKTRYKNTKYCLVCRLARNLKFIGETTLTCVMCQESFAPLKRGDEVCGKCDDIPAAGDPRGTCGICKTENTPIVNEEIKVCKPCATDPEKRKTFRNAILLKRRKRIEAKEGN